MGIVLDAIMTFSEQTHVLHEQYYELKNVKVKQMTNMKRKFMWWYLTSIPLITTHHGTQKGHDMLTLYGVVDQRIDLGQT